MDRDYFQWGATAKIMEIIRRRRKSPETHQTRGKTVGDLPSRNNAPEIRYERAKTDLGPLKTEQKKPLRNRRDRRRIADESKQIRQSYQPLEERIEEEQGTTTGDGRRNRTRN